MTIKFDHSKILAQDDKHALILGLDVPDGVECSFNLNAKSYGLTDAKDILAYMASEDTPIGWGGHRGQDRSNRHVLVLLKDLPPPPPPPVVAGEIWFHYSNPVESDTFCAEIVDKSDVTFRQVRADGQRGPILVVMLKEITSDKGWIKKA